MDEIVDFCSEVELITDSFILRMKCEVNEDKKKTAVCVLFTS